MEHAYRLLAAAFHQMWKVDGIAFHPQGGLVVDQLGAFARRGVDHQIPFLSQPADDLVFLGLRENNVATGLFGRTVDGVVVFHPAPWQGPTDQLVACAPRSPFAPVSDDPTSPHLLGFTLSESTPGVRVGDTAFGADLERAALGMALDVFGLQTGKVRTLLRPVVAPFYGRCTVAPNTFRFTTQGCSWLKEPDHALVEKAMDRAFLSLMVAHGLDAGHLAVAPTSHFTGHMLLPLDVGAVSMHARLDAIALWRHHSA
jgi:hypothetical protein